jgi:hypothetical protein
MGIGPFDERRSPVGRLDFGVLWASRVRPPDALSPLWVWYGENPDLKEEAEGMSSKPIVRDARRSTRVPLKVVIEAQGITEPLSCEGETIVVNLHGALTSTAIPLNKGMRIKIEVNLTGKHANAEVVYVDPEQPLNCGIALAKPANIWGVSLPPDDWYEGVVNPDI